jgi:tRNA(fMet)-specific endonuclease VapC
MRGSRLINIIGHMDMLIAAHAKSKGFVIVTNNVREFERVEGLELENWTL